MILFGLAFLVYAVDSRAWPYQRGRDAWDYLVYYLSLFDGDTPFPLVMLVRTPVTPLVLGLPLQVGGAAALELVAAILFAGATLAWAATARLFSWPASVIVAVGLLVQPGFAIPYHEASSDMVTSAGFALLGFVAARSCLAPSTARFAAVGAVVALLILTRPPNVVLFAAVALPILASGSWRRRLVWGGACLAVAAVPVLAFMVGNDVRYGELTLSRQRIMHIPFFGAFFSGRMEAEAGPASRRLAGLIERDVLSEPAYRRLGVDVSTYLRSPTNLEAIRLLGLVDSVDGRASDYALLHEAALEVDTQRRWFARLGLPINPVRTTRNVWQLLNNRAGHENRIKPAQWPTPEPTREIDGHLLPNPAALPPPTQAVSYGFLWCASDEITRCILEDPRRAYEDPTLASRYTEVTDRVRELESSLGRGTSNRWLAVQLDRGLRKWPLPSVWLAVAIVAMIARRPRGWPVLLALLALALLVLAAHGAAVGSDPNFALPVVPVTFVACACSLLGVRRVDPEREGAVPAVPSPSITP
ncbi:MAG: hypothetical protein OEW31_02835 [Thermoleophilia bacterium]|nr:hypothetical protein [Thermoleophilia bacterium]